MTVSFHRLRAALLLLAVLALLLSACSFSSGTAAPATPAPTDAPSEPTPSPAPLYPSGVGKVRISEVMSKNKATLQDASGAFPDWIEIENLSSEDLDLTGWALSKDSGSTVWEFPSFTLYANSRALIFASKNPELTSSSELHATFALSEGDTVALLDRNDDSVSLCAISEDKSDYSLIPDASGAWSLCATPTPGQPNTADGYEACQNARTSAGPLVINEVCVENFTLYYNEKLDDYPDWVEIKNISSETVDLSSYYISDDRSQPLQGALSGLLSPGQSTVIVCSSSATPETTTMPYVLFSLSSDNEQLFLSSADGTLLDFVSLREIPYGLTYGRLPGRNGFFYLTEATPQLDNTSGERRVAEKPTASGADGVFNEVASVTVELSAPGEIYYTLDATYPTTDSLRYTGPITVSKTTVVRAINVESGAIASAPLTLSYIINEGHTLPVASLVSDNTAAFQQMYANGRKFYETPGSVSFYEDDGSFTIGCGIKMYGESSLVLPKKNMSLRFRGCYGSSELDYDLFDGGVTSFTNLILRAGQDQYDTIVRNELCYTLAHEFSDNIITPRYRYIILYVDGVYNGIYTIMEKPNEQLYASIKGVSKSSVEMLETTVYPATDLYQDVFMFIYSNDMSDDANFAHIEQYLDIDSLIDWNVLQGYLGNYDLAEGNLRFVRSSETDGRWQLVFYDLDCAFSQPTFCQYNVYSFGNQISRVNTQLLKNENFRQRILARAADAFSGVLSVDHVLETLDALTAVVEPEVTRDSTVSFMTWDAWQMHLENLTNFILDNDWLSVNIKALASITYATGDEVQTYFGSLLNP